jgi:dolichyl-diphosphooligosaccharide--protein glycosyltransferase
MAKKMRGKGVPETVAPPLPTAPAHEDRALNAWQWLLLFTLVFLLCDLLRIMDGPGRLLAGRTFDGIPLLQTADSYAWLAAAKNINLFSDRLLPAILRIANNVTGIDLGIIGYYLPLFLAPLVIIPVFMLAMWWRVPEAAVPAGLMAGASYGFLSRTLTGWLDTDLLTLFFPLSLAVALLVWLEACSDNSPGNDAGRRFTCGGALASGLLFRSYLKFYPNGEVIGLSLVACALLVGLCKVHRDHRFEFIIGILIIVLAGNGSMPGFLGALLLAGMVLFRPAVLDNNNIRIAIVVLAVPLFAFGYPFASLAPSWLKIIRYGKIVSEPDLLKLPSIINTVEEAQSIDLQAAVRSVAGNWLLLVAGAMGFVYCSWKRPALLVLSPLLLLGLLCGKLGARFGMYGGAPLGIGLGFGVALLFRSSGVKAPIRWFCQAGIALIIFWTAKGLVQTTMSTDWQITGTYAEAFRELRRISPPGAQLWTWWDWGYAAQYFSERTTFADGGRNASTYVVPLAKIHYTSSPLYASQLMRFTAEQQAGRSIGTADLSAPQYHNPFIKLLAGQDPQQAQRLLDSFNNNLPSSARKLPEQYFAITWGNLNYLPVMASFGSWNLATGKSLKSTFGTGGDLKVDIRNGAISYQGRRFELAALDMVSEQNGKLARQHNNWTGHRPDYFAVANSMDGSFYPMDASSYHSLMVQMLIAEPELFEPYFKLVIDRAPHIRIYRLNVNSP